MKKCRWLLSLLWLFLSNVATAQNYSKVKGSVLTEAGNVLSGVTVTVTEPGIKKQVAATYTDDKGLFTLTQLSADRKYDFAFSYVGYETGFIRGYLVAAGENNSMLYRMKLSDAATSQEVVVTALGIKREEKSIGYAAQTIKQNAVTDAKTNNWVNALSGKVAGLNIQGAGAGPVGSSRITLRGESSLILDNNQALIVLDGVPVSRKITGINAGNNDMGVDFGSSVSDINPDDIEKITVLKGPGATALYGSRAAGGALIITTKSGLKGTKGVGITVNSNVSFEQVNRWPDYQFEYGEGRTDAYYSYGDSPDGVNTSKAAAARRAWGPKFNGQLYYQYDPNTPDNLPTAATPWVPYKNYIKDFFKTGVTYSNTVTADANSESGAVRLSVTHLKNQFILPNGGFERINAALSVQQKVTNRFRISGKVNYTHKTSDNLPIAGYNNHTSMYFFILGTAPNIRPEWFMPRWVPGQEGIVQRKPFNPGPENPYVTFYDMINTIDKNGVIGSLSATYDFTDKLQFMLRSGLDLSHEFRTERFPYGMTSNPRGRYREQNIFSYESNTDALLSYSLGLGRKFSYKISGGANIMKTMYNFSGIYADNLAQPNIYQISNSADQPVADPVRSEKQINSLYGFGQLSYVDMIFLDVTGRNDWSSTLPVHNNSFFYPSVSTSVLLNELLSLPSFLSYVKLRGAWAQVGNDAGTYQTDKYYNRVLTNSFGNPAVLYNKDLKPEIRSSYEFGLDLRMFKNRLGLDIAVYADRSKNQILAVPLDPTSGYSSALLNAGLIQSKGVEISLNGRAVVKKNFSWNSIITWSTNRSYVKELAEGITNHVLYNYVDVVTIEARIGERMGNMYGRGFQRSPEGEIIYSSDGLPATVDPVIRKMGNAFADWRAGWLNEFNIHSFRISIQFDGQMGGSMFSHTNHKLNTLGKTKVTLPGRDEGIVGEGVVFDQVAGKYVPNTQRVSAMSYYDRYYALNNVETNIFNASYLKLREVRLEYTLPRKWISRIGMQQVHIAVYGRELFNITNFPAFDPDGGTLNNGSLTPGVEITQFPTTRNLGLNLTFKF